MDGCPTQAIEDYLVGFEWGGSVQESVWMSWLVWWVLLEQFVTKCGGRLKARCPFLFVRKKPHGCSDLPIHHQLYKTVCCLLLNVTVHVWVVVLVETVLYVCVLQ